MVLCSGSNLESFLEEDMLFRLDLRGQAGFGEAETGHCDEELRREGR